MSEVRKGNVKKQQIVKRLINEITSHGEGFSLFSQEEAIDSFSLEQIRANARKEGIKLIFIPNKILKIALLEKGFANENFDQMLKNNNFIVLAEDAIKSASLINCIKDKKLKNKIKIKSTIICNNLFHKKEEIEFLVRAGTEKGIKAMFIKILRGSVVRFLRTLHLQIEKTNKNM